MSEAKHTKGPWYVDDLGEKFFLDHNHRWGIGSNNCPTYRVAKVEGMGEDAEANARLIAAAPELLAACEAIKAEADMLWDYEHPSSSPVAEVEIPLTIAELRQLAAAIRKAKGE